MQFPVVAQMYFGVRQECLRGLEGLDIQHMSGEGRDDMKMTCDPFGENLVKATLPGARWTYHHDEVNQQIQKMVRQSRMVSQMKIEDFFIRKMQGMVISPDNTVPILNKHLKEYV